MRTIEELRSMHNEAAAVEIYSQDGYAEGVTAEFRLLLDLAEAAKRWRDNCWFVEADREFKKRVDETEKQGLFERKP